MANDEELAAANAFLSIAAFGSTAIGFAGAGLLAATIGLTWAFILDAISFLVCAVLIGLMGRYPMPTPDEDSNVRVIVANLKEGFGILFGTPIIRSLFIVGAFMFVAFGLWNVLLLPFSIEVLGATEFEYGLQEGLTSRRLRGRLVVDGALSPRSCPKRRGSSGRSLAMGVLGIGYALSTTRAGGHPAGDAERVRPAAVVGLAGGPPPAAHARERRAAGSSPPSTSCAT